MVFFYCLISILLFNSFIFPPLSSAFSRFPENHFLRLFPSASSSHVFAFVHFINQVAFSPISPACLCQSGGGGRRDETEKSNEPFEASSLRHLQSNQVPEHVAACGLASSMYESDGFHVQPGAGKIPL